MPIEKSEGDEVFAGTLNEFGILVIRTTHVGSETKLGQIVQLVKEAQERKGKVQRLADKYAQWFVPVLLLVGGLTFLLSRLGSAWKRNKLGFGSFRFSSLLALAP